MKPSYLVVLVILLYSCKYGALIVPFQPADGTAGSLGVWKNTLGNGRGSVFCALDKPVAIEEEGYGLYVQFRYPVGEFQCTIYSAQKSIVKQMKLPDIYARNIRYLVSIPSGDSVWAFRVQGASVQEVELVEAGIIEMTYGFSITADRFTVSERVEIEPKTVSSSVCLPGCRASIGNIWKRTAPDALWRISFGFAQLQQNVDSHLPTRISLFGQDRNAHISVEIDSGRKIREVYLYQGLLGFNPHYVAAHPGQLEGLTKIEIVLQDKNEQMDLPIKADIGAVLHYRQDFWRNTDYELFSWDMFPDILVFDTADYLTQSRFFKRLAFFVEKKGYTGVIQDERTIAHVHGYNAHDYRAQDLADFFTLAESENISLNPEEQRLKDILLVNRVILRYGEKYFGAKGGLLSISRSSRQYLRRLLITHECFHGVFFSSSAYSRFCFRVWRQLHSDERTFWNMFLEWSGYDTQDQYLVVNEFQAYLLQQDRSAVTEYFRDIVVPRLEYSIPEETQFLRMFKKTYPESFERAFRKLDAYLQKEFQLNGGDVINLEFVESPSGEDADELAS